MTKSNIPLTPVYYNPRLHLAIIKLCASEGMTFAQIAEQLGLTCREFAVWRAKYAIINDTILAEREGVQAVVENKLYQMALGLHEWDETTVEVTDMGNGIEVTKNKTVTKRTVPSVNAQIFILKNIAPDDWKDKQEVSTEMEMKIIWNEYRSELPLDVREQIKALPAPVVNIEADK